jgi:SAM-dependent methyltransferase
MIKTTVPRAGPEVAILDAKTIGELPAATGEREAVARRYVRGLVTGGARAYVDNAHVETRALLVGGKALPLVLSERAAGNADVCVPSVHYVGYSVEELAKRHPRLPRALFPPLAWPFGAILRAGGIDRVVFVNNWLLPTNPAPRLSAAEIAAVTARLTAAYPDAAVVFRSVNPWLDPDGAAGLRAEGYRLVRSRRVYVLDARSRRWLRHENARADLHVLARTPYEVMRDPAAIAPHVARLAALYQDLYLRKHSRLNPHFTAGFFARTLEEGILIYRALRRDEQVDGFIAYFIQDGVATGAILGYERALPRGLGLYRMLFALLIAEAAEQGLVLNLSAGAGHFKALRGAVPVEEFDAVYDRHLPTPRRLVWAGVAIAGRLGARSPSPGADADWDQEWDAVWKAHHANPWFRYQADAYAAWLHARAPQALARTPQRILKTDAFEEACGFDPLRPALGARGYVLMDVSARILCHARRGPSAAGAACVTDVRALAFRRAAFDFVVSPSTLDHFADPRHITVALREMRRVLRPDGHMIVALDNPANPILRARRLVYRLTGPVGGLIPFPIGQTLSRARLVAVLEREGLAVCASDYLLHVPRLFGLWLGEWAARRGHARLAAGLRRLYGGLDRLLGALPTRRWTGHFVVVDCRRPPRRSDSADGSSEA